MSDRPTPQDLVLRLIQVVNGDVPLRVAEAYLHPRVRLHVGSSRYCGIKYWLAWVHLIQTHARVGRPRLTPCQVRLDPRDPGLVRVTMQWSGSAGLDERQAPASDRCHVRYLVRGCRIVEIWTKRTNYSFVFGPWVRSKLLYCLFLIWAVTYFVFLAVTGREFWNPVAMQRQAQPLMFGATGAGDAVAVATRSDRR